MSKHHVRDVEMTIDEETGDLEIKLPGWRENPARRFTFNSGDSFPLGANRLSFDADSISKSTQSEQGIDFAESGEIKVTEDGADAELILQAQGDDGDSHVRIKAGNDVVSVVASEGGVSKIGVFNKVATPSAQAAAIPDAVDAGTAITRLNALLAAARAYGWIAR